MSSIEKLGLSGIRSYNPDHFENIEFFKPLTIIWGHNGSGKTTIIESLKLITTGLFPPNSLQGKTLMSDPNLLSQSETKSQINLKFKAINEKPVIASRSFQLTANDSKLKLEMKSLEQILTIYDKGKQFTINHRIEEFKDRVSELFGASPEILEKVVFCHQEESQWPFGDPKALNEIFDKLFDTSSFTKQAETINFQRKELAKKTKDLKSHLEYNKKDYDKHLSKTTQLMTEMDGLNKNLEETQILKEFLKKAEEKKKELETIAQEIKKFEEFSVITHTSFLFKNKAAEEIYSKIRKEFSQNIVEQLKFSISQKQETLENLENHKKELLEVSYSREKNVKEKQEIILRNNQILQKKKNDYHDITLKIQNISQSLCEVRKNQEKISALLSEGRKDDETEENFNERLMTLSEKMLQIFENEKQKIIDSRTHEEITSNLKSKKNEIYEKNQELKNLDLKLEEFKKQLVDSKIRIELIHKEIETKKEIEHELSLNNSSLENILTDHQLLEEELNSKRQSRNAMAMQINELRNLRNLNKLINHHQKMQEDILNLEKSYATTKTEFEEKSKELDSNPNNTLEFTVDVSQFLIEDSLEKMSTIDEKMADESANLSIQKKLFSDLEENFQQLQKSENFPNFSFQEKILTFEEKYNKLKKDKKEFEDSLVILCFVQENLLNLTKDTGKCAFCDHEMIKEDIEKLNNLISKIGNKKELHEKLENLKNEKQNLKNQKNKYAEFHSLIKKLEVQQKKLFEQERVVQKRLEEKKEMEESINTLKKTKELAQILLGLRDKLEKLQNEKEKQNRFLKDFEISHPEILKRVLNNEEINLLNNDKIYERLGEIDFEITKKEEERNVIQIYLKELKQKIDELTQNFNIIKEKELNEKNLQEALENIRNNQIKTREEILEKQQIIDSLVIEEKSQEEKLRKNDEVFQNKSKEISRKKFDLENFLGLFKENISIIKENKVSPNEEIDMNNLKIKIRTEIDEIGKEFVESENIINENQNIIQSNKQAIYLIDANIQLKKLYDENSELLLKYNQTSTIIEKLKSVQKTTNSQLRQTNDEAKRCEDVRRKIKYDADNLETTLNDLRKEKGSIEETYIQNMIDYEIGIKLEKDLETYQQALEQTISKFHRVKMEEINKILAETWKVVYDGDDINKIEIKADSEEKQKSKNYRIVYFTKENKEVEMKGRCSMGQKVLASIVIRLALAEAFGINCGILALDEPTANLDWGKRRRLAKELGKLIKAKKENETFQLILITHDKEFVKLMNAYADEYYEICKNGEGWSTISKKEISDLEGRRIKY